MSIAHQLTHTCTIQAPSSTPDAYNARTTTYAARAEGVPCRLVEKLEASPPGLLGEQPITTRYLLLVLPGSELAEGERVTAVDFRDGTSDAGPFVVRNIVRRRAARRGVVHVSAQLERVGR